jgi:glutamate--cysteine ligase catalytic subunit
MVLQTTGHPLSWEESGAYRQIVKNAGIDQFITHFHKLHKERGYRSK